MHLECCTLEYMHMCCTTELQDKCTPQVCFHPANAVGQKVLRQQLLTPLHAVPAQTVQHTAFKPEMLMPASLRLVASNISRQPKRVAGADGRAAAAAAAQFEPRGLPPRSGAQLLGAFTNRAVNASKLCFMVSFLSRLGSDVAPVLQLGGSCCANNTRCKTNQSIAKSQLQ
jgi:hypothetical protein